MKPTPFQLFFLRALDAKGLTPEQFAHVFGLSKKQVTDVLHGHEVPTSAIIKEWSKYLKLSKESADKWHDMALAQVLSTLDTVKSEEGFETQEFNAPVRQKLPNHHWICVDCWTEMESPKQNYGLWVAFWVIVLAIMSLGSTQVMGTIYIGMALMLLLIVFPLWLGFSDRRLRCRACKSNCIIPASSPRGLSLRMARNDTP